MRNVELQVPLRMYSRGGQLIAQIGEQRRIPVAYEESRSSRAGRSRRRGRPILQAPRHRLPGVLRAIAGQSRVTRVAARARSTITMQAARNMFLTPRKDLRRKLQEVFVTYRMEQEFTKEQILATYLNVIFFGQRSYGIAAAAETYFGKPLKELTVAEAATLAGLPKAPSQLQPGHQPASGRAAPRLRAAADDPARLHRRARRPTAAANEPMQVARIRAASNVEAPYVAEMVRLEVRPALRRAAQNDGYKVYTTVDSRLQAAANRALRLGLIEYDRRHGYRGAQLAAELACDEDDAGSRRLVEEYPVGRPARAGGGHRGRRAHAEGVYVRGKGIARIDWDGMSWAARSGTDSCSRARHPKPAADVWPRGDVVYVVERARQRAAGAVARSRRRRSSRSTRTMARSLRWSAASITSTTASSTA